MDKALTRRQVLRDAGGVVAAAALTGLSTMQAQQPQPGPQNPAVAAAFPGFRRQTVATTGATINTVIGGSGPPLLLLHGAPQSHFTWRLVAPRFAANRTVIAMDLRGYGDSSKPADGVNHANYSKRAMAQDAVDVMKHFGFNRFDIVGQDRGGRVTQRLLLDHPEKVGKATVIDIVPTYYLYTHVTIEFVQSYFHWFNYLRPAPTPENELKATNDQQLTRATTNEQREYLRTMTDPATIHAMCEDYRAGASIDLDHDRADIKKKINCPLLVLWAEKGPMDQIYDVLAIWKERGSKVSGKGLAGGHNMQEGNPDGVYNEISAFLKA